MDSESVSSTEVVNLPPFNPVTMAWQIEKCDFFNIQLSQKNNSSSNTRRQPLNFSRPDETQNILGDGNCFFRALSFVITGSQSNHAYTRPIILGEYSIHLQLLPTLVYRNICVFNRFAAANIST
jgi:hypothetical protein